MSIVVNRKEWKTIFLIDSRAKLTESKKEFVRYKATGKVVYLQQACNKLFSVVENWLMVKYDVRVQSYQQLRGVVKNNAYDRVLLSKASQLHYFYYENVLRGEPEEFEDMYLEVYKVMKERIR
jgi:hypothetical protein